MQKDRTMRQLFLCLTVLLSSTVSYGQKQGNIWYFGNHAGLDFNNNPPTPLLNGLTDFPHPPNQWNEGSSSISDSSGSLLFYTDGEKIWNKQQQIMPNGSGLMGHCSSTQSSIIVPQPGNSRYFYVFTTDAMENNFINGFRYSVVDICLDNGNGDVISGSKNVLLADTVAEKLVCVRHSNGLDYWIIVQKLKTDIFYSFQLSSLGIVDTVVSHTGNPRFTGVGQLKASPNSMMLANATVNDFYLSVFYPGYNSLLDFNSATGIISNERLFSPATGTEYAVEFSSDNSKLYFSTNGHGEIYQYDLNAGNLSAIIASKKYIIQGGPDSWRGMMLGPDGKIYISRTGRKYLSAIEFPNNVFPACNYIDSAIYLGGKNASAGLPNFITGYDYSNTTFVCPTGIKEEDHYETISIFPNPFSEQTTFQTAKPLKNASLTVYNSVGQTVKRIDNLSGQTALFHRDNLPSGLYFFRLTQDGNTISADKFVVTDK